jgi:plastocyanin
MRPRVIRPALVPVALVLAGCSSTSMSDAGSGPPTDLGEVVDLRSQQDITVEVADNIYEPRALQVSPGAVVTFRNDGANPHNVTPNQEGTFAAVSLAPTESGTVTVPASPGTYRYYCTLHASPDGGLQRGAFVVG